MPYQSEAYEQRMRSLAYLNVCFRNPHLRPGAQPAERDVWRTDIHALHLAETFYWNSRTVDLVASTLSGFNLSEIRASRELLWTDCAWHWFGEKAPFSIKTISGRIAPVKAITWYTFNDSKKHDPFIGATAWTEDIGFVGPTFWICTNIGDPMSKQIEGDALVFRGLYDETSAEEERALRHWVVAASTFLRQELLVAPKVPVERHVRKRLGLPKDQEHVLRVVSLRKASRDAHGRRADSSSGETREYDFQWVVSGHARNQWYPSLQEHLPIWIGPYVKGPEGKPLKPRTAPLYSVTR